MTDDGLRPLTDTGVGWPARKVVRALGLRDGAPSGLARPRVVAVMIASTDGRAAIDGRSVGLGCPADRALLRELRAGVDAVLVGTRTLAAERYGNLLDAEQREYRVAAGMAPEPIVATISRALDMPTGIPLLAEPTARVQVYTEVPGEVPGDGAWVAVHRFEPGVLSMQSVLAHLQAERGVATVLCEGGPTLLRQLVAAGAVDDLLLTVAPKLVAGAEPPPLAGASLHPPADLRLRDVRRAGDHLFLHYAL